MTIRTCEPRSEKGELDIGELDAASGAGCRRRGSQGGRLFRYVEVADSEYPARRGGGRQTGTALGRGLIPAALTGWRDAPSIRSACGEDDPADCDRHHGTPIQAR